MPIIPYSVNVFRCQRYCHVRDNIEIAGYQTGGYQLNEYFAFPVEMRAAPTIAITNGSLVNVASGNAVGVTKSGFVYQAIATATGSVVLGNGRTASYIASARL